MRFSAFLLTILIFVLIMAEGQIIYTSLPVFLASLEKSVNASDVNELENISINQAENFQEMVVIQKPASQKHPLRDWQIADFETMATSVFAYDMTTNKVLFEKKADQSFSIASLTKLLTGLIVKEYEDELPEVISFEKEHLNIEGACNIFREGEKFTSSELLKASLVASNNEATFLLADTVADVLNIDFKNLMNQKAQTLNMQESHFSNPIGFDGDNFSTAKDLLKLAEEIIDKYPDFFETTCLKTVKITSIDNRSFYLSNTNQLIGKIDNILGSKTGHTDLAKDCLLIIREFQEDQVLLIVLGARDRELEMGHFINWVEQAYNFK
jgi:serine-type D-Ala-D-Ala carboxypeptidase (penicillin-binding protein 5/6)